MVYTGDTYSLGASINVCLPSLFILFIILFTFSFSIQPWGAVSFYNAGFSTNPYSSLVFAISAPASANNYVFVSVYDANGNGLSPVCIERQSDCE